MMTQHEYNKYNKTENKMKDKEFGQIKVHINLHKKISTKYNRPKKNNCPMKI